MNDPDLQGLDEQLQQTLRRYHRLRWISLAVLGIVILVVLAAVLMFVYAQNKKINVQQTELGSSCFLDRDIAGIPLTAVPPARLPSELLVVIAADARFAYIGSNCPGSLPPNPSLARWARYYHIPLSRPGASHHG